MNFLALLTLSFTLLVSSTSSSSFSADYRCEGLTGRTKTEFENLMIILRRNEPGLNDCMFHYDRNKSKVRYNMCIRDLGLPDRLESYFILNTVPVTNMGYLIHSAVKTICFGFKHGLEIPRVDDNFNSSGISSMNSLRSHQEMINNFESGFSTFFVVSSVIGGLIIVLFLVVFGVVLYKVVTGHRANAVIITNYEDEKSYNKYNKDVKINIDSTQLQSQYSQSTESIQPPSYQEAIQIQSDSYTQGLHSNQTKN